MRPATNRKKAVQVRPRGSNICHGAASCRKLAIPGCEVEVSQVSQSQRGFPVERFPKRVAEFVAESSAALDVDPSLVAGPCLAALVGCIGNRRRIVVKQSWTEPACLWIAVVVRSGGKKTPAISLVLDHLHEREAVEIEQANARQAEYEESLRKASRGCTLEKPEPAKRLLVSDVTTEAVLSIHSLAPLGLLLHRDELAGWLKSFNQYKGGKGADAQCWTEMHQGRPALIDRKGGPALSVPRACVSICGGVQPELLAETLQGEHLYDGVASRVLFVVPEERAKTWNEDSISDEIRAGWTDLLDELQALTPTPDGNPIDLPMTADAKVEWVRYYNDHAEREDNAVGPFRSAMSKLEAATARLALVLQLARDPHSIEVDVEAMTAGAEISEWFEDQALRVYQGIVETREERDRRELCEWIAERHGSTTSRELSRYGPNRFRKRAKEVLDDLVTAGLAQQSKSGRRVEYRLCDTSNERSQ